MELTNNLNFNELANKVCADRGLLLLSPVSQGGYFYVRNASNQIFPVLEVRIQQWVELEKQRLDNSEQK